MSKQRRRNADMVAVGLGAVGLCLAGAGLFAGPSHAGDMSSQQVEQAVQLFQGIRTNPTTHAAYCEMVHQQRRAALADQHEKLKVQEAKNLAAAEAAKLPPAYAETLRMLTHEDLSLEQARRIGQARQALSESCPTP